MVTSTPTRFAASDARALQAMFAGVGANCPDYIGRAVSIAEMALESFKPTTDLLDMTDDQVRAVFERESLRQIDGGNSYLTAATYVGERALAEAADRLRAGDVDKLIKALRPEFDKHAKIVVAAAGYGITARTTPAEILDRDDSKVTAVWKGLSAALTGLNSILNARAHLSRTLGVSPTIEQHNIVNQLGFFDTPNRVFDWSVTVAGGDNWSANGATHIDGRPELGLDWLNLARGGLHLNTPAEVDEKIANRMG